MLSYHFLAWYSGLECNGPVNREFGWLEINHASSSVHPSYHHGTDSLFYFVCLHICCVESDIHTALHYQCSILSLAAPLVLCTILIFNVYKFLMMESWTGIISETKHYIWFIKNSKNPTFKWKNRVANNGMYS